VTLLDDLRGAGVLSDLDVFFAESLGRLAGERRGEVLLAAALASRAVRQGHVCLDLARTVSEGPPCGEDGKPAAGAPVPSLAPWAAALRDSPLVSSETDAAPAPLVLDAAHRLYLRRYWLHERSLAASIARRVAAPLAGVNEAVLAAGLARLFGPEDAAVPDMQRVAARTAVTRRFCVISGGPGTGKTHTVVRILALAIEQALAGEGRVPEIRLMAPTGKAAARLQAAVRDGAATLDCMPAVRDAIPVEATTIHRALGASRRPGAGFRRHGGDPLGADLVVVDEASMVDLALMARLFEALPPEARVVLLGDRDQLASVEAGAVLGDICNIGGTPVPAGGAATGIAASIVQLDRSYRFAGGIGALARAINAGDVSAVWRTLDAGGDVGWLAAGADGGLGPAAAALVERGLADFRSARTAAERMRALERFRVLCAHRHGPGGVTAVNAQIEHLLAERGAIRLDGEWYVGRPILVTRNDYQLQLFNGDVGIIAAAADDPARRVAVFVAADGTERRLSPARLPPHETVFAMSVHKSQGSEFDAVAVLLPSEPSPVVSRELLYTAVTRARRQATIIAPRAVVEHAVTHAIARASGLRDRLWGGAR
jgi:exodeoxyribonuclease V alpha subunit